MEILQFLFEVGFWAATVRMATPLIFGARGTGERWKKGGGSADDPI